MPNGRCRFHGGKSTGPRTEEGRRRCGEVRLVHGRYTREARERGRKHRAVTEAIRLLGLGREWTDEETDAVAEGLELVRTMGEWL
jgi:hypothetical protein